MIKYIDSNTRINLKWYSIALDWSFCLQRKKWYGWKTVSWNYVSILKYQPFTYIIKYLLWSEENRDKFESHKIIGEQIMSKND